MVKLLTITWNFSDSYDIEDTFIFKSFIKNNNRENFVHIHYNRNEYSELEEEFKERFDFQYEYILYKIFLSVSKISEINATHLVFCDANDVVCLDNIQILSEFTDILFSAEANQYPSSMGDWVGLEYSILDRANKRFLNAGVFIAPKEKYIHLLETVISKVLTTNLKSLGGDQGVYIFHYLSNFIPSIQVDKENTYILSTYTLDHNLYLNTKFPLFVHDNGWNYGSPRFIEKFNLA